MIPYGRQNIDESDIQEVAEALRSSLITQGGLVTKFENKIASYVGAKHAVAVNSATSALYLAYRAMGIDKDSIVWTVTNTFVATSNAAILCGAKVDFIDIDKATWNISVEALEQKLVLAREDNSLPDVVTVVHFAGLPCEMEPIWKLSQDYGFRILEDASHALGAKYKGEEIGGCQFSDAAVFSFHPVKMITTGEGGMITTNSSILAKKALELRSHGVTRESEDFTRESPGPWYFEQQDIGLNLRLTDFQCALGLNQLGRLGSFIANRSEIAYAYLDKLAHLPLSLPNVVESSQSSWHLFVVRVNAPKNRDDVISHLRNKGIAASMHYIPVPYHPYYQELGFSLSDYPESENYYRTAMSLPIFAGMTEEDLEVVVLALTEALS